MSRRLLVVAALGVVASAILPAISHAQLGGLTKKASKAAAQAAGVPTGNERYVSKIDMTAAQITAVNQGLAKAIQIGPETIKRWEKAQSSYEKAMDEYRKKVEARDKCIEAEQNKAQGKLESANKKSAKATDKLQSETDTGVIVSQARAAQAAAERISNGTGTAADRQTVAEFQKTMAGVSSNSNAAAGAMQEEKAMQKAVSDSIAARCGPAPTEPTLGGFAGSKAGKSGNVPTSAADEINQQSADAAGMTEDEYRVMREKAMGYVASHTQVKGSGGGAASTSDGASSSASSTGASSTGGGTSDAEAAAINKALAETGTLWTQANKANVPLM